MIKQSVSKQNTAVGDDLSGDGFPTARDDFEQSLAMIRQEIAEKKSRYENNLTDIGNAARFAAMAGSDLKYVPNVGWHYWDGRRYAPDEDNLQAMQTARKTVRNIIAQAGDTDDDGSRRKLLDHANRSSSTSRLEAMVRLARSETDLIEPIEALNVENGLLNLKTGELDDRFVNKPMVTKLAPVTFDPDAKCEKFERFLAETFRGDVELIRYVQTLLGFCLTGFVSEHVFPIFMGRGGNGKSVLLDTICHVMGDYACQCAPDLLLVNRDDKHPTGIADLAGRRLTIASESKKERYLNTPLVKRATGDRRLKGRHLYKKWIEFNRTHKTILVTNEPPLIEEDSDAVWRRVLAVPFTNKVNEADEIKGLDEQLINNSGSAVLNWLIEGARRWIRERQLRKCQAVTDATARYRARSSPPRAFVEACCTMTGEPDDLVANSKIEQAIKEWWDGPTRKPTRKPTWNEVKKHLTDNGAWEGRVTGGRYGLRGIQLKTASEDNEASEDVS